MKASKRLKQSLEALEARARMPVNCPPLAVCKVCRVVPDQPSPLAIKLARARIFARLSGIQLPGDSVVRPPGCKRRGGKWVRR